MRIHSSRDLAATIRGRRLDLGLSQSRLAEMAGVSRKSIWDVERGKATASFGLLLRLLQALDLDLDVAPAAPGTPSSGTAAAQLDAILTSHLAQDASS